MSFFPQVCFSKRRSARPSFTMGTSTDASDDPLVPLFLELVPNKIFRGPKVIKNSPSGPKIVASCRKICQYLFANCQ